jgi:GAF domain-containing protein
MGSSSRFKKKDVEVVAVSEKEKHLTLIKETKVEDEGHLQFSKALELGQLENNVDNQLSARKLACYHKINEMYQNSSLNLFNLMKGILDIICIGVDAEGGSIWIVDEQTSHLNCRVANGPGSESLIGVEVEQGLGIVGWSAQNKKSTIVYDASKDERFLGKKEKGYKTNSLIASPLIYNDELIGVLEVVNKNSKSNLYYNDDDKLFLEDLSTLVAMHIKVTRMVKGQEKLINRMETFSAIHQQFAETIELDKLLVSVLTKAIGVLGAEVGSIWLTEKSGEGVVCEYAVGPTKDKVEGLKVRSGSGIIGSIIERHKPVIVEDCQSDERFNSAVDTKTSFKTKSMVAAPFLVKGECIGAIQILNKKGSNALFEEEDLELLELFASSAGMYIKNAKLFESEKKAKDLSALIEVSNEITSTLDLDSVLMSIVNLSSSLIQFDEADISTIARGTNDVLNLRAISGQEEIDILSKKNRDLEKIHNYLSSEEDALVYYKGQDEANESAPKLIFEYMKENNLESFLGVKLKDDQGLVGLYSFESEEKNLLTDSSREILSILISQCTVALRNAELYNSIPNSQIVKSLTEGLIQRLRNFKSLSRESYIKIGASASIIALALVFIKIPKTVSANIEILPRSKVYYSQLTGKISDIYVLPGQTVNKGQVLAKIDTSDSELELKQKEYGQMKVRTEMLKHRANKKIADYKIKELEYLSLDSEVELLKLKIKRSKIYSDTDGVITSESLEDLIGMPVNFGQEIIKVASHNNLIIQFQIPENEVSFVRAEQDVKFKVYGHPTKSFSNEIKLSSVSGEARQVLESDPARYYLGNAKVNLENKEDIGILRPGMTGRGKVFTDSVALGKWLFRPLYNFIVMEIF